MSVADHKAKKPEEQGNPAQNQRPEDAEPVGPSGKGMDDFPASHVSARLEENVAHGGDAVAQLGG
ncbi:MAG: hypothetical protein ACOCVU_01265, partial [Desulfohalobiaceae bacterium]